MANKIANLNLEEKIRFFLLRYGQDLVKVKAAAEEYAGKEITVAQIKRVLKQFRAAQTNEVAYWIACNVAQEVIQGSYERQSKLETMYKTWEGKENAEVSSCCKFPVRTVIEPGVCDVHICLKCNQETNRIVLQKLELEDLKMRIIKEMRKEGEHLLKFAKQMGFNAGGETPENPHPIQQANTYILAGSNKEESKSKIRIIDAEIAEDIDKLDPVERMSVLHKLQNHLEEIDSEENISQEDNAG